MLIDARWQRHLITTLQLEPLFQLHCLAGTGRASGNGHTVTHHLSEVGDSTRLLLLLKGLGVGSDVVEASVKRNGATIERAAAIIADWKSYLPEDCVKAMVSDGWHWST